MTSCLDWMPMNDIVHAHADKVVLRCTKGDSEWIDCSSNQYKLVAKKEPWEDAADFSNAVFIINGVFPNEAIWLGENNEPGRIVFELSKKDTSINPRKGNYYCRIIEMDNDGNNPRTVFMGKFKVIMAGDIYQPLKEA